MSLKYKILFVAIVLSVSPIFSQTQKKWVKIGGPARDIYLSNNGLYAISPQDSHIFRWNGKPGSWQRFAFPAYKLAVGRVCYILPKNKHGVYLLHEYSKTTNGTIRKYFDFVKVGGPAADIRTSTNSATVWAMNPDTGRWYEKSGKNWQYIGGPVKDFQISSFNTPYAVAVDSSQLYRFPNDGSGVYSYSGNLKWKKVGGPAKKIYCSSESQKILATNPTSGDLYLLDFKSQKWTKIGGPGKMFVVTSRNIYALSYNDSIYQYQGTPEKWKKIWGPAKTMAASEQTKISLKTPLVAIHKNTNEVWALIEEQEDKKPSPQPQPPQPQPSKTKKGIINLKQNICADYSYQGKNPIYKGTLLSIKNNTIYRLKIFRYVGYGPTGEKSLYMFLNPREEKSLNFTSNDLLNGWGGSIVDNIPCSQAPPYISFSIVYRQ